jgi:hypothetical protein
MCHEGVFKGVFLFASSVSFEVHLSKKFLIKGLRIFFFFFLQSLFTVK